MKDLVDRIKRVGYQSRTTATRDRMTDEQVKETLREAAEWIWYKNPYLPELAGLAEDIERLERMHTVVESQPVGLKPLADTVREEYEDKLRRFHELAARADVKRDLENLHTLVANIEKLIRR